MSGLAAVLAGHEAPGVWRWNSAQDPQDVAHTVEHAGWLFGRVDGWTISGKLETLTAIGEALAFPAHYGRNLDALADCLRDREQDTVLLWDGWSVLAAEDPRAFAGVNAVLMEASVAVSGEPRLVVLLRGAGPDLPDTPLLG